MKRAQGGLLSRIVPALLVIALLSAGFAFTIGDYQDKFDFTPTGNFNQTYNYSEKLIEEAGKLQGEVEGQTTWEVIAETVVKIVYRVPRLVIGSFGYISNIVSASAQSIGLPIGYAQTIGTIINIIIIITLIFAFASIFARRPI